MGLKICEWTMPALIVDGEQLLDAGAIDLRGSSLPDQVQFGLRFSKKAWAASSTSPDAPAMI